MLRLKNLTYTVITALTTTLLFPACGETSDNGPVPDGKGIDIASVSVKEGDVLPSGATEIKISYTADIILNSRAHISISGGSIDSVKVRNDRNLHIYSTLLGGKEYVLNIPSNAVTGKGSNRFAPEVTIGFKTEANSAIADKSKLDIKLSDPHATADAKAVFETLIKSYGEKQISGAMGGVAWESGFYDLVTSNSGKKPAIIGFDYIHLSWSPANWIDYGDITPVKKAWENGSLPALMWHWNVPSDNGISCDASNPKFKASNVLVDGTPENRQALKDVEKLAGYLKLIQDAGIPVLWRPFHEAAGDYKWGAWFWWGNSGTDTTKKLWHWLRTKLIDEYGIHNLIWTWTVQTSSEGKPASISVIKDAYPGNETVDLIGTDIYPDESLSDQTAQFETVYTICEGKKMVELCEIGNLTDPDKAASQGALWGYFMGWYEYDGSSFLFKKWNTKGEWTAVLANSLVLNRGDIAWTGK